jgi:tetratricopeptide (TPR) repeat protein
LFARRFEILETDTTAQALEKFRHGTQDVIDIEQADLIGQMVGFDFKISPTIRPLLGSSSFSEISELYLKNYLRSLAGKSLLIILEDLQWMDDRTLDFISEFVLEFGGIAGLQLMILCTARPQFFEKRPKWGEGIRGFITIKLRKLSRLQSRSLIEEILFKVEDIPEDFYECVVDEAGGNPFFIEEMIRMFFDEGVITPQFDSFSITLEKLEDLHVPSTLKGILQARLDSLPLPERNALQRAAIIGRTFWDGLVKTLTENQDEVQKINNRLEALRDRNLIFHRERSSIAGNEEYIFKHALLRDEAYESVLLKHRRNHHKRVSKWIGENAGDRLEEHLAMIAYHTMVGGEADLAADWYIRAGKRALSQCSLQEARRLFEKALALLSDQDVNRIWRATLGHDEAVGMLGEVQARHADDMTLLELAKKLEDEKKLTEAYYRVGSQANSEGNHRVALRAFDHALDIAGRNKDLMMEALILPMKVTILTSEGDLKTAGSLVDKAQDLARQTENPNILARALNNIAPYYQMIGDISKSIALMQEQIDINQQQGNRLGETYGLINLGYFYLGLGHFENAHRLLERAYQIAQSLSARMCMAYSMLNLGLAEWRLNRPQQACEVLHNSAEILEALGDQRGLASRHFYLGLSYETGNNPPKAVKHFTSARESFKDLGITPGIVEAQAGLARLELKEGNITRAEDLALQIFNFLDKEGPQGLEFPILVYLTCVQVFDAIKDTALAQHVLEEGSTEIQARLELIREEDWKEVFLEKIPENRLLLTYQKEMNEKL